MQVFSASFLVLTSSAGNVHRVSWLLCDMVGLNPESYEQRIRDSWIWKELHKVRNIRPSFSSSLGMYGGLLYTGTVWYLTQGREPWTFSMHTNNGSFLTFLLCKILQKFYGK